MEHRQWCGYFSFDVKTFLTPNCCNYGSGDETFDKITSPRRNMRGSSRDGATTQTAYQS